MGRTPFGFIGVNLILFGALGFAPMRSECFAGLRIALMLITVHLSGWRRKRYGPTCARFQVHLL